MVGKAALVAVSVSVDEMPVNKKLEAIKMAGIVLGFIATCFFLIKIL